jgi:hypothetical protein
MLSPRKAFSIHSDYYRTLKKLPPVQLAQLLNALIDWAEGKEPQGLDPACDILFGLMTDSIERISKVNSENAKKRYRSIAPNLHEGMDDLLEDTPKPTFDDLALKGYGTNGLVLLSDQDYNELLDAHSQAKLDKGIEEVDLWLSTLETNNVKDFVKQVHTAIERNWNRVSGGKRSKRTTTQNVFSADIPPDSLHEQDFLEGVN